MPRCNGCVRIPCTPSRMVHFLSSLLLLLSLLHEYQLVHYVRYMNLHDVLFHRIHLGTRQWLSGKLHAQSLCLRGNSLWHPLDNMLGGSQNLFGCGGQEKNYIACREPNPSQARGQSLYSLNWPAHTFSFNDFRKLCFKPWLTTK